MSQAMFRFASGAAGRAPMAANGGLLTRFAAYLAEEWHYGREISALGRLDDRELGDIGIGRGELDHAVRHGRASTRNVSSASPRKSSAYRGLPASFTEWR